MQHPPPVRGFLRRSREPEKRGYDLLSPRDGERRPLVTDWKARAEREAAAIIAEATPNTAHENYEQMVRLMAIAWLQGANYADHLTLGRLEDAFDELRAAL